ncbi:MAG: hypothetical protein JXA18_02400 [Chitinispirillaceae bacterium]|nr:hypothetical protein [Chitinispirillaceae bacterium]
MSKKSGLFISLAALAGVLFNPMQCANPVDDPPIRWRSNIEIPVSNERFIIGEELDNLFEFEEEDVDILNVLLRYYDDPSQLQPDTIRGDTVMFSAAKTDSSEFESHEEAFDDKEFHVSLGSIPISGASDQHDTLPLPAVAGSCSLSVPVTLDSIYEIGFAATTDNILSVRLSNTGTSFIDSLSFGIDGIDTVPVGRIDAGESATAELPVAGKTIGHTVVFFIAGEIDGSAGQSIAIDYSLNGLEADYMKVDDHLVNFTVEFVNPYELTDTVDVDYIDIGNGFFIYKFMNYTDFDLIVKGVHEHMWVTSFTELRGITRFEDLVGLSHDDSTRGFFGKLTGDSVKNTVEAHREATYGQENLSLCRLFPEWDDSLKKSVTKVRYIVSSGKPGGDTVTIRSSDSLLFTIQAVDFKFKEMQGTLTEGYERQSDTQKVAINLPWNNTVKDSLRGKFILEKVWGDVFIGTEMPQRAFLDTLRIDFIAFAPESALVQDTMLTALTNVMRDSTFFRSIDITDVANLYSDSVAIAVRVYVPKGTKMRVVNDLDVHDPDYDRFIGRMIIHVNTQYRLNAKLDWKVDGLVNMDLGSSRFKMDEAFRFFHKLEDRSATFEMWLRNNSNLNLSLYSLVAPDALMDTLDSLTMNEVYAFLKNPGSATQNGYVNLFGDTGISVPERDTTVEQYNVVVLNDQQLETLFGADSLNFRWWIQFREQDRDALIDTDYVDMRSRFGLEGINNTDSLLIWE